ncbi:MAG: hypothetical protein IIA72_06665 [Proteobacteria bacterium]|nr:hypothetical protein [Pseudomonadota bacterium]
MEKTMYFLSRAGFTVVGMLVLASCVTTASYDEFYTHQSPVTYPPSDKVIYVDANPGADKAYEFLFDDFLVVGRLDFNGPWEGEGPYVAYGRKVGADIVLASTEFESDRQVQGSYSVPTTNTTYLSVYGSYGSYYSGTATTYGTTSVPYSYNVRRYDHTVIFLKKVKPDTKAPWEYTKSNFPNKAKESQYSGTWKNDNYVLEIVSYGEQVIGFIREAGSEAQSSLVKLNPNLSWSADDLKFRFDAETGLGFYLMASKSPKPAKFRINKFGHLEVEISAKTRFSFLRIDAQS